MSAWRMKAVVIPKWRLSPLLATRKHSQFLNNHRNVAHRDAGGGAVHSIRSGYLPLVPPVAITPPTLD